MAGRTNAIGKKCAAGYGRAALPARPELDGRLRHRLHVEAFDGVDPAILHLVELSCLEGYHIRRLIEETVFQKEDIATAVAIQRGMACGANSVLQLGRLEHEVLRFHRGLDAAIGGTLVSACG